MKDIFFTVSAKTDDMGERVIITAVNFGFVGLQIIWYAYLIGLGLRWGLGL